MEGLQVFQYQGKDVRTVKQDGQTWWVLADVCQALDLKNPPDVSKRLDEDERMTVNFSEVHSGKRGRGGAQQITIINEPGLYSVILRSNKPEAKAFKRWITHEVLPAIHATGAYGAPQTAPAVAGALERMTGVVEALAGRIEALERQAQGKLNFEPTGTPTGEIPRTTRRHWMRKFNEKLESMQYDLGISKPAILRRLYDQVEKHFDVVLDEERFRYIEKTGQEECSVLEIIYRNEEYRAYFQYIINQKMGPEYWDW